MFLAVNICYTLDTGTEIQPQNGDEFTETLSLEYAKPVKNIAVRSEKDRRKRKNN